ncbi:MAG: EpsG family protein [Ruminococcus flavefaciens]|nr:EpsG family protein [Ruminococcus flavefaciens]
MLIYLITFFLSYALLCIGQNKKSELLGKIYIIIALLLPSILAGCRDYSIGTDVLIYGNNWFRYAVNSQSIVEYIKRAGVDMGAVYAVLNYIVAMFTDNTHWFYFVHNAFTVFLIYKAAKDNEDLIDVPFAMLTYYLLFYNQSLNLLRQSIAVAFAAFAFKYIRKHQIVPFIICSFLAIFSHLSAIVVITLYIIYITINGKLGTIAKAAILIASGVAVVGFTTITRTLIQIGIFSNRYEHYLYDMERGGGYVRLFLLCIPYLILLVFCTKTKEFSKEKNALVIFLIMASWISILAFRVSTVVRIAYYYDIYLIFTIPYIARNCKYTVKVYRKNVNHWLLVCFMLVYWTLVYVIRQGSETVPYLFMTS